MYDRVVFGGVGKRTELARRHTRGTMCEEKKNENKRRPHTHTKHQTVSQTFIRPPQRKRQWKSRPRRTVIPNRYINWRREYLRSSGSQEGIYFIRFLAAAAKFARRRGMEYVPPHTMGGEYRNCVRWWWLRAAEWCVAMRRCQNLAALTFHCSLYYFKIMIIDTWRS